MTEPRKPAPRITWETIERVTAEGDRTRIEAMSEAEIDEELRNAGIDPERAARIAQDAIDAREPAAAPPPLRAIDGGATGEKPRAKSSRFSRWAPWAGAAALAAGVLLVLAKPGDNNVGGGNPGPSPVETGEESAAPSGASPAQPGASATPSSASAATPDSPAAHAARLRENAASACEDDHWEICERLLNEAKNIDPAGEKSPLVIALRRELAHVTRNTR